jgi:hypothetical protein
VYPFYLRTDEDEEPSTPPNGQNGA